MKKHTIIVSLLVSLISLTIAASGCSIFSPNTPPERSAENSVSENSESSIAESADEPEGKVSEIDAESEIDTSSDTTQDQESSDNNTESENDQQSDEESSNDFSENESDISFVSMTESESDISFVSMTESESDISFVSMTESEAAQASNDGYEFDDEQIVEDYHTAVTFTDNEEFNEIFKNNAYDSAYNEDLKNAVSIQDMRTVTESYGEKWKAMVSTVYNALSVDLDAEENEKLSQSQEQWLQGLAETESSFMDEAKNGGTEGLLSADTAIMNYYKGRAAKLLEQIYTFNGGIDLSAYGL